MGNSNPHAWLKHGGFNGGGVSISRTPGTRYKTKERMKPPKGWLRPQPRRAELPEGLRCQPRAKGES